MRREDANNSYLRLDTSLAEDTSTCLNVDNVLSLRLFSARCRESQAQGLVNQDYILVNVQHDASSLCFCVCDGVGSSYRGDFAARYLGTRLVQWLHTLTPPSWSSTAQLRTLLGRWATEAQVELQQRVLPPEESPAIVREVLEELRDTYGSETVFLAGRINAATWSTQLQVSHPTETFFCWMGNITARLFITGDQYITLGGEDESTGGWSTGRGPRGTLKIWNIGLTTIERLLVHTDGLNAIAQKLVELDEAALQAQARQLLQRPESDDMTSLDLHWFPAIVEMKGA